MAHLHATDRLKKGDRFVHESYICSQFTGRVEDEVMLGDQTAIIPSIEGHDLDRPGRPFLAGLSGCLTAP